MQNTDDDDRRTDTKTTDASSGWRREYRYQAVAPEAPSGYDPAATDTLRGRTRHRDQATLAEWAGSRP